MERDKRRGRGVWTGCHTFEDIMCDGDEEGIHEKRAGGLKMGGTYWYFYRVDDEGEIYDDTQDTTTACPLMPGQTLNVMDVPCDVDLMRGHHRSPSLISLLNVVKTLNPKDRYTNPKPMPQQETKFEGMVQTLPIMRSKVCPLFPNDVYISPDNTDCDIAIAPTRHLYDASGSGTRQLSHVHAAPNFSVKHPMRHRRSKSDHVPIYCPQPGYSASCARRAFKSAPASPRYPTFEQAAPTIPYEYANDSTQARKPSESEDLRPVRDSISGGQSCSAGVASMMQSLALSEDRAHDPPSTEIFFLDQWPQAQYAPTGTQEYPATGTSYAAKEEDGHAFSPTVQELVPSFDHIAFLHRSFPDHPDRDPPPPPPPPEAPSFSPTVSSDALTPLVSLLPQQSYIPIDTSNMRQGLQALNEQYTFDQHNTPWRSQMQIAVPESLASSAALISDAASPIFSSVPGDESETTTSYRLSDLRERKPSFADFDFQFNLDDSSCTSNPHIYSSFEHLSVHTTESADTTSTVMPYLLDTNPFAGSKVSLASADQRELREAAAALHELAHGTSNDLLDEFEYLGAALL